ncbi:hypothetical protein [Paenibacillus sp. ATY16]|uniref:hypothetical protein n=1 Tax=Paenibacillus sp. ATY16 TaxID=1759312 RepID=UPI00200DA915|nr:hypothetical protein [Paenibacillus sp. ATY16]MCK9862865.1 hypothetical protein [Paenibacillus sp. ATY16]
MSAVIHNYAKYHAVLVIVGGLLVILFAWLSIRLWTKFKRNHIIDSFAISDGGSYKDEWRYAFIEWIRSGNESIPAMIQQKINARIEFHAAKAFVCGALLIIFVALGLFLWNSLIKRSKAMGSKWRYIEKTYFISGIATVALSLLLMVMVVANTQGAIAPLTAFLVGLSG